MLLYSAKMLSKFDSEKDQYGINMSLENLITHGRNLLEFFYYQPKSHYARVINFVNSEKWQRIKPPKTNQLLELEKRASNEMSHLTFNRINGTPPEKFWNWGQCLQDLLLVVRNFLDILPEKYCGDKIISLKNKIKTNNLH